MLVGFMPTLSTIPHYPLLSSTIPYYPPLSPTISTGLIPSLLHFFLIFQSIPVKAPRQRMTATEYLIAPWPHFYLIYAKHPSTQRKVA